MTSTSKAVGHEGKEAEDNTRCESVCHAAQSRSSELERQTSTASTISTSPTHGPLPSSTVVKTNSSQPSLGSRTFSHSLLSNSSDPSAISRKSKFADSGTTSAVGRASISMPPPTMKPSSHRPPMSRQSTTILATGEASQACGSLEKSVDSKGAPEFASTDDSPKIKRQGSSRGKIVPDASIRSSPSESIKPTGSALASTDNDGHRLSFSSFYSLGSAVYNAAAGGSSVPSAPSSNAGSVKSGPLDQPIIASLPASSYTGSNKLDTSSPTTATDPISVSANARSPHAGLRITRYFIEGSYLAEILL